MEIYITNLETSDRLQLPMLPTEVKGTIANKFASYSIIKVGDVKIPSGTSLDTYTWSAKFPGQKRKNDPFIRKWTAPKECDKFMRSLQATNGKAIKARLLITETPINLDVYLQTYSPTESGGYGDISYSVTFIKAKKIEISTSSSDSDSSGSSGGSGGSGGSGSSGSSTGNRSSSELKNKPAPQAETRTSPPKAKTYTVVKGDCLWKIAQKFYGSGAQYSKIADANKSVIGSNPNLIYPGQVLTIP